jgi:chorismate mutase / prephenate dehydratase
MSDDQLKPLRDELDSIDVEIQNLLTRRAEISLEVKKVKGDGETKLKPGREAQILRALIERHQGHFPKPELIRIWREILSASLQAQGPFLVAVYKPDDDGEEGWGYVASARGHFGAHTPMISHSSQRRVIEAVLEDECSVGILPLPKRQEDNPWWRHLAVQGNATKNGVASKPTRIIAKLPFAAPVNSHGDTEGEALQCLVIAKSEADPSGLDGTYIALDLSQNISNTRIDARLVENGMTGSVTSIWHDAQAPERWLTLLNVDGFISSDDAKLDRLTEGFSDHLNQATILGSYALPLSAGALASETN